jgi:outer membrane receptor protein involved in Fe transport
MKIALRTTSALCTGALAGLMVTATPAFAQTTSADSSPPQTSASDQVQTSSEAEATATQDNNATPQNDEAIVVTGSRIQAPNQTSAVPITSVTGQEFFQTGRTSVGDVLNDLPSLQSTFSQSNSTRFLGTAGLSLLDLRGLGTERTLVLVNGRRHVAGDILNTATSVDINTIPTDLIESVDVVTGGNSAVYGSDAIAGVVNFVLKDHYEGLSLRGQGGISGQGDAGSYYLSGLAGTNFADGRGNVAVNVEYAHQAPFYASDRSYLRRQDGFVTVDTDGAFCLADGSNAATCDPTVNASGSDGIPDAVFTRDIRSGVYSNAGTFLSYFGGDSYTPLIFQKDGTLAPQTGTPVGLAPTPSYVGGNGDNFRDGTQLGILPKLDRYSANLVGHFEISPAFVPFVEATYTRTDSLGSASGPFFTGALGEQFYTDNPYLSNQAKGIIRDYYGIGPTEDTGFTFYKNAVDLTNREEAARRETYRIVGGVKGTFNDDWNYEVSANYGEFREKTTILGNINLQRYFLGIDAVDQGLATTGVANGNVVCRSQVDPAAAVPYNNTAYAAAQLAGDVSSCVPVNLFGSGNVTDAARNYLLQNSYANGKLTQFDASAFINGDTSQFFNLPGGPVRFAIGGEYRRETLAYNQDATTAAGLTFYNALPDFHPTAFEVKELYGELQLPIAKDTPFLQELTASVAGRVSDYKGSAGTVYAYNAGLQWAPIRSLRLRGNYARSVRAPNLVNLYTPLGQNYSLIDDPCSARNVNQGSSTRAANCTADGVPAGYDFVYRASLPFLSGGNPDLKVEKSDSYTIGGVFTPAFLPGFSVSADYYDITVNDVITSPSAQQIIDTCYDSTDLSNQFCQLFSRNTAAVGPNGEIPGQIVENSLQVLPLNYAKLKVRGIDFDATYRHQIGNLGLFALHGVYTLALQNSSYLDPTNPDLEEHDLQTLGLPKHAFNIDASFRSGPITFGYKVRFLDKMLTSSYADYYSVNGRDPENADAVEYKWYPTTWYHDFRLGIDANDKFNFYAGIDNAFDTHPPFGLTGVGFGSGIYQVQGRFFYAGAVAKF